MYVQQQQLWTIRWHDLTRLKFRMNFQLCHSEYSDTRNILVIPSSSDTSVDVCPYSHIVSSVTLAQNMSHQPGYIDGVWAQVCPWLPPTEQAWSAQVHGPVCSEVTQHPWNVDHTLWIWDEQKASSLVGSNPDCMGGGAGLWCGAGTENRGQHHCDGRVRHHGADPKCLLWTLASLSNGSGAATASWCSGTELLLSPLHLAQTHAKQLLVCQKKWPTLSLQLTVLSAQLLASCHHFWWISTHGSCIDCLDPNSGTMLHHHRWHASLLPTFQASWKWPCSWGHVIVVVQQSGSVVSRMLSTLRTEDLCTKFDELSAQKGQCFQPVASQFASCLSAEQSSTVEPWLESFFRLSGAWCIGNSVIPILQEVEPLPDWRHTERLIPMNTLNLLNSVSPGHSCTLAEMDVNPLVFFGLHFWSTKQCKHNWLVWPPKKVKLEWSVQNQYQSTVR